MEKSLRCCIVGSGMASRAMLAALDLVRGEWQIRPERIPRGMPLPKVEGPSLLLLANPHALHAPLLLEAQSCGFSNVVCEKPVAVNLEQVNALRAVEIPVAVCHGYRMNWGPQRIRQAIEGGELGQLVAIEGRYWQSSAAAWAVENGKPRDAWKNNPEISGGFDTLLDLGTHWADLVSFLLGGLPDAVRASLSYINAEAPHRDTHVHLEMDFRKVRTWGSVSKTVHGAGNHLEVVAIGEKALMRWSFEKPDELVVGKGRETRTLSRSNAEAVASSLPAHHALGWLEGYASILSEVLAKLDGRPARPVPSLKQSLDLVEKLLTMPTIRRS